VTADSTDPALYAAREQAPRSLWDATYNETSWVHDNVNGPITLIPRMLGKIAAH
jgi:hypothetical protein